MNKHRTVCGIFLALLAFAGNVFAQTTIFSETFESGTANAGWGLYRVNEELLTAKTMSAAPSALTAGGSYVGFLQDKDASYSGVGIALAGATTLKDYSIEADVYCFADSGAAYTGLVVYADSSMKTYLKLIVDLGGSKRLRLYNNDLNMTTFAYSFDKKWLSASFTGGLPTVSGWHNLKIEVRTTSTLKTDFWCYFDGVVLPGCPVSDTSAKRMSSGRFGLFSMQQDVDGIPGYFDNIVVKSLPAVSVSTPEAEAIPSSLNLLQNYPNPFNPETQITFALPNAGFTTLAVYDVVGRLVKTLVSGSQSSGYHTAAWDGTDNAGRNVPSGIYIYSLKSGNFAHSKKMVLAR